MYGYFCEKCGASLDPNEHCTCEEEQEKQEHDYMSMFVASNDGQMTIRFEREEIKQ